MVVYFEPKGGRVQQVYLKNLKNYHSKDTKANFFNAEKSAYRIQLPAGNRPLTTDSLYFTTEAQSATVSGDLVIDDTHALMARAAPTSTPEFLYTV